MRVGGGSRVSIPSRLCSERFYASILWRCALYPNGFEPLPAISALGLEYPRGVGVFFRRWLQKISRTF